MKVDFGIETFCGIGPWLGPGVLRLGVNPMRFR
jgi:hypothetical protein